MVEITTNHSGINTDVKWEETYTKTRLQSQKGTERAIFKFLILSA